jgi:AbrB family looped-hinge helix DNA binding protein
MAHQLTVKGQVTIPKRVRDHLGLKPGSGVEFELGPNGEVMLRKAGLAAITTISDATMQSATAELIHIASNSPFSIEVSRIRPQYVPGSRQYFSSVQLPCSSRGQRTTSDFIRIAK